MKKNWHLQKVPVKFVDSHPEYSLTTLKLLYKRGIRHQREIDAFFNMDYETDLHNPYFLKGMKKTVSRIKKAIKNKEKILIFGDFDVDGICGAAILITCLKSLRIKASVYIPDRKKEGHGMNIKSIREISKKGVNLIITVDCGISNVEEVNEARKLGIEVIIVDHHRLLEKIPKAYSIIDPYQKGDKYPFKQLSGAGVAFKLAQALLKDEKDKKTEKWLLDLVALATVADVMPIIGENRVFVKYGLVVLAQTKRVGLRELMKMCSLIPSVDRSNLKTNLDTYSIGFILGPRLNAASRMDHANSAYRLLLTNSKNEAVKIASDLSARNKERQDLVNKIVSEIENSHKDEIKKLNIVVASDKNWPPGVVGLVAGKIQEKHKIPAFICNEEGGDVKCSGRSTKWFNIVEVLEGLKEYLEEFGGHPQAGGFLCRKKNMSKLEKELSHIASLKIKNKQKEDDIIHIDAELFDEDINFNLIKEIEMFEPFGVENEEPVFLLNGLKVVEVRTVGNGNRHMKLKLESDKGKVFTAIGFGFGEQAQALSLGDKINLVFNAQENIWNGRSELQIKIIDFEINK